MCNICNETERDKNAHSMFNNRVKSLLISIYPRTIRVIKEGSICGIEHCGIGLKSISSVKIYLILSS